MSRLRGIVDSFANRRIVVVGDLIADQFLNGDISRVSREAPVFILRHERTETRPGGAANAATNIAAMGASAVLIGVTGDDESGTALRRELIAAGVDIDGIATEPNVRTTTKVRVLAGQSYAARQQVIRIDYENSGPLHETTQTDLLKSLEAAGDQADALIVSDYGGSTVSNEIFEAARAIAVRRDIPIAVDSRYRLADLAGASTATPNREEVEMLLGNNISAVDCEGLRERLGLKALLVTNGNRGMTLFEEHREPLVIEAVGPKEPVDVTGAGDTVIAAYTLALAAGSTFADAAAIANYAGGLVVMKKGTATVTAAELTNLLDSHPPFASRQAS